MDDLTLDEALDAGRLDDVLTYFAPDAVFTIQTAFVTCEGRDSGDKPHPSGLGQLL